MTSFYLCGQRDDFHLQLAVAILNKLAQEATEIDFK